MVCNEQATLLGNEHPDTLRSQHILARVLFGLGHFEECERLASETSEKMTRVYGRHHPLTTFITIDLMKALSEQRRFDEAITLGSEVLVLCEEAFSIDSLPTINSMWEVGHTHCSSGNISHGLSMIEKALKCATERFGIDHPATKSCSECYNLWIQRSGRLEHTVPDLIVTH